MNSLKKCPYTSLKQSQLGKIVSDFIESIKQKTKQLTGNEPFTYKWAHKYLGLKNNKREIDTKYKDLSINEISHYLLDTDTQEYHYMMRSIENEISTYIFHQMLPNIQDINIDDIDFSQYKDGMEHIFSIPKDLINTLTQIANEILIRLYNNIKDETNTNRIYQVVKIYLQQHNKSEISDRLKKLLFDDGIENTVHTVFSGIHDFIARHEKYDRKQIEKFIKNDESFWLQIGLVNIPLIYMERYSQKPSLSYSVSANRTIFNYSQKEFIQIVEKNKEKMPPWVQEGTYSGCPLLFTHTEVEGEKMNGILAYQKVIYGLILDRIDGYKAYNREREKKKTK